MSGIITEKQSGEKPSKYPLVFVRDLPYPAPFLVVDYVEKTLDFKPKDSDIFVVTYPKCGTTWTQFIVWEILNKGAIPPSPNEMMFRCCPFLEVVGLDGLEKLPSPRVFKTHLPFHLQPYNSLSKYIYIVRNPWDVCVSYYNHHKMDPAMPQLTFSDHIGAFITGQIGWGDYIDHALSWYKHRNDPNVLFLTYENMKKDKKKALLQIAKFLGDSYCENLQNEEVLANCLKYSDFDYLKEVGFFFPVNDDSNLDVKGKKEIMEELGKIDKRKGNHKNYLEINFFRKGEVGDWRNHFSSDDLAKFNEYVKNKLRNTEMENFWGPLVDETSL